MKTIDDSTKQKISAKIAEVEQNCDSELVCLVTNRSARYVLFPLLIAAIAALFMPIIEPLASRFGAAQFNVSFGHQTILFVTLAALFVLTPLSHMLTPRWLKQQNGARVGTEQFFSHQLHDTQARNAVLIFVSWDEKFVTIVADKGIDEKVLQSDWDGLVSGFVGQIKAGKLERGFLDIIGGAGELLVKHFPVTSPKTDELSNHLITQTDVRYIS